MSNILIHCCTSRIISDSHAYQLQEGDADVVGSSLLSILEDLALTKFPSTGNISTRNIGTHACMHGTCMLILKSILS